MYSFMLALRCQFCSLFKGVSDVISNVDSCVKSLLFRRLFVSFQWTASTIFVFAIKRHFPSSFSLCVPPRNADVQTELTFSSQFAASHYGIRRTLWATGVSTVYDVRMATKISTEEKVSASQPGLSHDDIRANDSVTRHEHDVTWFTLVTRKD